MWRLRTGSSTVDKADSWLSSLNNHLGRQIWCYDPEAGTPQEREAVEAECARFTANRHQQRQSADTLLRLQFQKEHSANRLPSRITVNEDHEVTEDDVTTTLCRALQFYSQLQTDDGHWSGDHSGPMFFLPGMVIALYVTGALDSVLSEHHQREICRYIYNHQRQDGSWGLHPEGTGTLFGTVLSYVTLRLMGESKSNSNNREALRKAQTWIIDHGGATDVPSWGKFWLAVLGVYEWSGVNPLPPESWLLPKSLIAHPGRLPVLYRFIFLPMSYIYARRLSHHLTKIIEDLRKELYTIPYEDIDWNHARKLGAKEEIVPRSVVQDVILSILHNYVEPIMSHWPGFLLRQKALALIMEHIHHEDETTQYLCVCPVSKALNMLCCWLEDRNSDAFKKHLSRVLDFLWLSEDGMKMQVCNGSQLWDTALSVRALISANLLNECSSMLRRAKLYIENTQIQESYPGDLDHWHRITSKGGWPQSTRDWGWPVSDCTAEALQAVLALSSQSTTDVGEALPEERIHECINVLLSFQKSNGSFAPFDARNPLEGPKIWNHTESPGYKSLDFECVECTSSVIQALAAFNKIYPEHRAKEISISIQEGTRFIERLQNSDGSWSGTWGICFTYATWFGIMGLLASGARYYESIAIQRACEFILSKQLPNGGWGEHFHSFKNKVYTNLEGERAHVVHTSWSMLALLATGQEGRDAIPLHRAAKILINAQMETGDYSQEGVVGAVCGDHTISYATYRCVFPIWALGEYRYKLFGKKNMYI
uniref:Alpha-onocerin synthase LCD n=1 Tax=Lycopodium clavatum TaxID=3252 RepID=LCD_LYCCL|nr:RecName: Full=Alpha-onocerin synthase LCD [Lycopodium clavatum]BAU46472.1 onocerin synthase [Lycopodium clavatum]